MDAPPWQTDPWQFALPPSVPPGVGGVFNAWGWVRDFFGRVLSQAAYDLDHIG